MPRIYGVIRPSEKKEVHGRVESIKGTAPGKHGGQCGGKQWRLDYGPHRKHPPRLLALLACTYVTTRNKARDPRGGVSTVVLVK